MNNKLAALVLLFFTCTQYSLAQDTAHLQKVKPETNEGMRIKFDKDGNHFLKINIWSQTWIRDIQNNPGTAVNGDPQKNTLDIGFRRMRLQMYGQVSPRFLFMLQMGSNNQSFASGGGTGTGVAGVGKHAPFYFIDAYGQFTILPEKDPLTLKTNKNSLSIGVGLHPWSGVSRLTNASTISILTADLPIFNWPTIEVADQLTRMFGVFAKGNLGKLGYRISINKPFETANIPTIGGAAVDNNRGNLLSYNGYFSYQFFDRDEITTPFLAGTYFGRKKVFNIGAGIMNSPKSLMVQPRAGQFVSNDMNATGVDVYYDVPIGNRAKDMAFTFYGVWYNYSFGKNYIRTTGVMNPGTADTAYKGKVAMEGYGNAQYLLGTGNIWYVQTAFLLPKFSTKLRLQPYINYTIKNLQALNQPGHYYGIGTNFLFDGNNAKISFEYSSRPLYALPDKKVFERAGQIMASIQFWL